ncbi:MAG: glycosyltransferase family 2 protein [Patescibacteria group bacterium]|jgi:glycosyltransferase involved in cell wall biosynthesis
MLNLSLIIPALNEEGAIVETIDNLKSLAAREGWDLDLIVVNDGSTDKTGLLAQERGARVIHHPTNGGYGRSLQDGIRVAKNNLIAITDADGTYPVDQLPKLLEMVTGRGFDMAVGARQGKEFKRGFWKYPARIAFRFLAEYVAGRRIPDINSGLRVFRRDALRPHLSRTCNGFSFTTSITLIFMLNGFFVGYAPIDYAERRGESKVRHFRDTLRTAQILISLISAYNPLKLFLLLSFFSAALGLIFLMIYYIFGYFSALWISMACFGGVLPIFALGCLAESVRVNSARDYE